MVRSLLVAVLALGGCHKLFDLETVDPRDGGDDGAPGDLLQGEVDAPECPLTPMHDEDADGIDDICDPCPTVMHTSDADIDTDGLPDECDPRQGLADRIVFRALFASPLELNAFTYVKAVWSASNNGVAVLAADGQLIANQTVAMNEIELRVGGVGATASGALTLGSIDGQCVVQTTDCGGATTSMMCVDVSPGPGGLVSLGSPSSSIRVIRITTGAMQTTCRVEASSSATASSSEAVLGTTQPGVTLSGGATTIVQSLVVYGPK